VLTDVYIFEDKGISIFRKPKLLEAGWTK